MAQRCQSRINKATYNLASLLVARDPDASITDMTQIVVAKPEDEELAKKRAELAQLESELADRELYLVNLTAQLAVFERRYIEVVGTLYAKLDDINARITERRARQNTGDRKAQEAAKQARTQANESRAAVEVKQPELSATGPSEELKRLYREVAKRVHPDLTMDLADRAVRERLMSEANRAYELGDVACLRRILDEYETSPETVKGEGTGAELVRVIRKITQVKKRLNQIEKEVQRVAVSEMAKLRAKSEEYERRGRNLLAEMAAQMERQIAAARREEQTATPKQS